MMSLSELRKKRLEDLVASILERLLRGSYERASSGRRIRPADAIHARRRDVKRLNSLVEQLYALEE